MKLNKCFSYNKKLYRFWVKYLRCEGPAPLGIVTTWYFKKCWFKQIIAKAGCKQNFPRPVIVWNQTNLVTHKQRRISSVRGACTSWQNYTDGIVLKSFTEKISSRQVDLGQNFHESVFFNRFQKIDTNKMFSYTLVAWFVAMNWILVILSREQSEQRKPIWAGSELSSIWNTKQMDCLSLKQPLTQKWNEN